MPSSSSDSPAEPLERFASSGHPRFEDPPRVWTREETEALFRRIVGLTTGGGDTSITLRMSWLYNIRWARNRPTTSGITYNGRVSIQRIIGNSRASTEINEFDDDSLKQAIVTVEKSLVNEPDPIVIPSSQQYLNPPIWSDATFNATPLTCSDAARIGVDPVREKKLVAGGYLETRAETWAIFNTKGLAAYAAGTSARYAETVRNPEGTGSGWAGVMHTDWAKINTAKLSERALNKCVMSANPSAIEPGRYVTILEPQAVGRFFLHAVNLMIREAAEGGDNPYSGEKEGTTKIGEKVFDERITISTDPMDPDCSYIPFDESGYPFRPVTWVENGVLKELSYTLEYAQTKLGKNLPLQRVSPFRMTGGETTIEEMIATTSRGVLVTNFTRSVERDNKSGEISTVTRDGLWLIEHGKIKCPIKNMEVYESALFIGNKVEQLGKPERIYGMYWNDQRINTDPTMAFVNIPVVVPPLKVRDFNFSALTDAI